jgi:hypothetical protein
MSKLIVLSGEAGAGKDSVAKILVENHGFWLYSLASPLKRFAEDMFGFTQEQLYGPSHSRNAPDPRWARPCLACNQSGKMFGHSEPHQLCGGTGQINDNSPRRVLQLLGEEYLRQMIHVDALTRRARPDIDKMLRMGTSVVVNDARNDNDRINLQAWLGAHRVDVRTPVSKDDGAEWRKHKSELSRPTDDQLEYVLMNEEEYPFPSLPKLVSDMLASLKD